MIDKKYKDSRGTDLMSAYLDDIASVEQQVACLMDLAADPNVLVRQWAGLATWI